MLTRDQAKRIVDAAMQLNEHIGKLDDVISDLNDSSVKEQLIASLATVIDELYAGTILVATKEFPELDPSWTYMTKQDC